MKYEHNNISPLDNRYSARIPEIRENFSEHALIKSRFIVEINWLLYICQKYPKYFSNINKTALNKIIRFRDSFDDTSVIKIKKIEKRTNHDIKAIEYFIRDFFKKDKSLSKLTHLIHFGLTSEDVNSLSYALMIKKGLNIYLEKLTNFNKTLKTLSKKWINISFLSRTHGQAASPSTIGKEIKVFYSRIDRELNIIKNITPLAKFSGATGNYHTFDIANEKINWPKFNNKFINTFGIKQNSITTQIESHDWIAELMQSITRINNICIDLSQDMWIYISNDIFLLKLNKNEVGSSTMPHKVNPIDFENAEGNFGISNSLNDFFVNKLTKSRLQRDLSDSTVLRNIGLSFGYSLVAISSINNGMSKISPNLNYINDELNQNWEILTEAVQTIMRYEGIEDAYEQLKSLSRGNKLDKNSYIKIINNLDISAESKNKLLKLTPKKYIGLAKKL